MSTITVGGAAATSTPVPISTPAVNEAAVEKVAQPQAQPYHYSQPAAAPAPVVTTTAAAPAPVSTTPVAAPAPVSTTPAAAPAPSSSSSGSSGAPVVNGKSILDSANYFRSMMGFPSFAYDSTLQGNAAKTNNDDGANTMTHELNPGSMAQCIAEVDNLTGSGSYSSFDLTYLGWLCEIADSRLGNACQIMEAATNMNSGGETGHAEILRTASYSKMGCNYLTSTSKQEWDGMWTCDFA